MRFSRFIGCVGVLSIATTLVAVQAAPAASSGSADKPTNVNVVNSPLSVAGGVTATQQGGWTVGLDPAANTVRASQNGPWSVDLSGPVALASGTTVGIAGVPTVGLDPAANGVSVATSDATPLVARGPLTTLAFRAVNQMLGAASTAHPIGSRFDASGFDRIRVRVQNACNGTTSNATLSLVSFDPGEIGAIDTVPVTACSVASKIIELPGTLLEVRITAAGANAGPFNVQVWGR